MLADARTTFGEAISLVGATGTALIGSQIDTGAVNVDQGMQDHLYLNILMNTGLDSTGGACTIQFILASDSTAAVSTTTSTQHILTPVLTEAVAIAGYKFSVKLPPGQVYEQFLGILVVRAGEAATVGTVTIWLGMQPIAPWTAYPDAVN